MKVASHGAARAGARWIALSLALVCGNGAPAGIDSEADIAAILARSPAPQIVGEGQELPAAERAAAAISGATAYLGVGDSMRPMYESNTAVVVAPIAFERVATGMTVVYLNRENFRVAHVVVGVNQAGYIVRGLGNGVTDPDVVTRANFVGVVVQAFAKTETSYRSRLALQLARKIRRSAKRRPA